MQTIIGILIGLGVLLGHWLPARADMVDVITAKLHEGCSLSDAAKIVDDVAAYAKDNGGGTIEMLTPLHSPNQGVFIVVGRYPNVAAFGTWVDHFLGQGEESPAGKLRQRARQCASFVNRSSAMTVK